MAFDVSEKYVAAAESNLEVRLPETYRDAMKKENGGTRKSASDLWSIIPIFDQSDRKRMSRTSNDIVRETKAMSSWTGWPPKAICIAQNGTGDALIFLREGAVCDGTVYLWNHETGSVKMVAQDFAKLKT